MIVLFFELPSKNIFIYTCQILHIYSTILIGILYFFFLLETGVKFVVTARGNKDDQPAKRPKTEDTTPHHFQSTTVDHFYSQHFDRQGIL